MEIIISYADINSKMWDEWVTPGGEWSKTINHEDFIKAEQGIFDINLTPCKNLFHMTDLFR